MKSYKFTGACRESTVVDGKFAVVAGKLTVTAALLALILSLVSCASLQQDVYAFTAENTYIFSSIEEYEDRFIKIDAQSQLEGSVPLDQVGGLLSDIGSYKSSTNVTEPYLIARLRAFEGLLCKMAGRSRDAEAAYSEARGLQKGDRYVQLLGCRLAKNTEDSLNQIDTLLKYDSKNSVLQLEKGKLLYQQKKYDQAISEIDNAFILFDGEGLPQYRTVYNPLRNYIWDLHTVYGSDSDSDALHDMSDLQGNLTLETMVSLTMENTRLLENYTFAGQKKNQKQKNKGLITNLEKAGYFSAAADQNNAAMSSLYITGADEITRKMCARFIWNAYVRRSGNLKMLSRYSEKYRASGRTKSPVNDVAVEDEDFDAVLGVIESEFMELPDGKNFQPDTAVTKLQFINWAKKADK